VNLAAVARAEDKKLHVCMYRGAIFKSASNSDCALLSGLAGARRYTTFQSHTCPMRPIATVISRRDSEADRYVQLRMPHHARREKARGLPVDQ
jgi:hypothetical protein